MQCRRRRKLLQNLVALQTGAAAKLAAAWASPPVIAPQAL